MRRPVPIIPSEAACVSTNLFAFSRFRTLLPNGALTTLFSSITSALFLVQRRGRVGGNLSISNLPYILPSSVCSKYCVFTLFTKLPGWGVFLPILVRPFVARLGLESKGPNAQSNRSSKPRGLRNLTKSFDVQGNEREMKARHGGRAGITHTGARCCETYDSDCGFCGSSRASA